MELIKDHDADASTGCAFVTMNAQTETQKVVSLLNSSSLEDCKLKVNLVKPRVGHTYRSLLRCAPALLDKNYHQRSLHLAHRSNPGSSQGMYEVVRNDLTTWGWRKKSYMPDRYDDLAENTGEPLSRIGDDG